MNFRQTEFFVALAETGSFRKTAERLYVSQPAVSKQIIQLEKDLGLTLFNRNYRSVSLTAEGRIMFDAVKNANQIFYDALKQAKEISAKAATKIRVGLCEATEFDALIDIMIQFQKDHPDVMIVVERDMITQLTLDQPENKYNIVVTHEFFVRNKTSVDYVELKKCQFIGFISEGHRLAKNENLRFSDFNSERFFLPGDGEESLTKSYCNYICNLQGFTPKEMVVMPNIYSVLVAVQIGQGVAVLDEFIDVPEKMGIKKVPTASYSSFVAAWNKQEKNPIIQQIVKAMQAGFHKAASS